MQISKLRTRRGDIPAIAMIDNKSPVLIAATLPFGFSGLLTADAPDDTLFTAVRTVAAGDSLLDETAQAVLPNPACRDELIPAEVISQTFTEREALILNLLADGKSNDEIAEAVSLSSSAVKQCLKSLFARVQGEQPRGGGGDGRRPLGLPRSLIGRFPAAPAAGRRRPAGRF